MALGLVWVGLSRQLRFGLVRRGGVRSGLVRQSSYGSVGSGQAGWRMFRYLKAVKLTYGSGWSRRGKARVRCGKAVEASTIYKSI